MTTGIIVGKIKLRTCHDENIDNHQEKEQQKLQQHAAKKTKKTPPKGREVSAPRKDAPGADIATGGQRGEYRPCGGEHGGCGGGYNNNQQPPCRHIFSGEGRGYHGGGHKGGDGGDDNNRRSYDERRGYDGKRRSYGHDSGASEATIQAVHSLRVENSQRQLHDQHPPGSVAAPLSVNSTSYVTKREEALPSMTQQTQAGRSAVAALIGLPQTATMTATEHAAKPASNNHQRQPEQHVYKPPDVTRFGYDSSFSMFGWKYFKSFIGLDTGQSLIK